VLVSERKAAVAVRRSAQARGQDLGVGDDVRSLDRDRSGPARREHADRATPPTRPTRPPASTRPTSTSWSCMTASHRRADPLRQLGLCNRARRASSSRNAARGATERPRSMCRVAHLQGGIRWARRAWPTLYEVATHLRGEAGDRQIDGARSASTHVDRLGSACAVHVLERRRCRARLLQPGTEAPDFTVPRSGRQTPSRSRNCTRRWVLLWWTRWPTPG